MTLPWDEFQPEQVVVPPPVPAPTPPPDPPPPLGPAPAPPTRDIQTRELADDLLAEAMDYAKQVIGEITKGHTVDVLHPTITAETATGRELVIADAKSRSGRTFIQGLCIDLFAAVIAVVTTLAGQDPFQKQTWVLLGALFVKTLIQTVAAYIMRLRITPTMKTEGEKLAIMPVPRPMIKENAA